MYVGHKQLGRQALAAFSPTTVKYVTAAFGGHAGTKTVSALTLDDAGLKCSFHRSVPIAIYRVLAKALKLLP